MDHSEMISRRTVPIAIVVVTYNRLEMLRNLCAALAELPRLSSDRVFIVDNASTDQEVIPFIQDFCRKHSGFQLCALSRNTGGAGGFCEGLRCAYNAGFEWIWMMDDDVLPLPGALEALWKYSDRAQAIQVSKYNADGTVFEFEGGISKATLKRHYLIHDKEFRHQDFVPCAAACFEGCFLHRSVIDRIGFPDAEFFIGWDDIFYGLKISEHFRNIYIKEFCLKKQIDKGVCRINGRPFLSSSLFSRYFHIRNFCIVIRRLLKERKTTVLAWLTFSFEFLKAELITLLIERDLKGAYLLWNAVKHGKDEDYDAAVRIFPTVFHAAE